MRHYPARLARLTLAAPLTLLAACGDTTPADEAVAVPDTRMAALENAADPLPTVPQDALEEVDFAGTYVRPDGEGMARLSLDPTGNTWEYVDADGTERRGTFLRMEDNQRIEIEDFDGETTYFAIAEGSIFRLADADASAEAISVTGQFMRDVSARPRSIEITDTLETAEDAQEAEAEAQAAPAE